MNIKYTLGAIFSVPLLPWMYFQGKHLHKKIPRLPAATGPEGIAKFDNDSSTLCLLAIGESTIAGVGVSTHEEGFTGALSKELSKQLKRSIQWKVYAESGFTTRKVVDIILPTIEEEEVDILILGVGGNDAFELHSPKKFRKDVRQLILDLKKMFPNTQIVFVSMPPVKEFPVFPKILKWTIGNLVEILGKELGEVAREYRGVYYHDDIISMKNWNKRFGIKGNPKDYFSDGIHPSKLAYQIWAKDIALAITKENLLEKDGVK
jgi:lysophospholipase L1-like esterase